MAASVLFIPLVQLPAASLIFLVFVFWFCFVAGDLLLCCWWYLECGVSCSETAVAILLCHVICQFHFGFDTVDNVLDRVAN